MAKKTYAPRVKYRNPLELAYLPPAREWRFMFSDFTLIARLDERGRMHDSGVYYRRGAPTVFEARDVEPWRLTDEQQRFFDAIQIAGTQ